MPYVYPSYDAVVEAHDRIVRRTGGPLGMLNPSGLQYVLETVQDIGEHRPEDEAIRKKAAYLLSNMINLHPFLDGNKRTALEVTKSFVALNGWALVAGEQETFRMLVSVGSGRMGARDVELWVGKNLSRLGT